MNHEQTCETIKKMLNTVCFHYTSVTVLDKDNYPSEDYETLEGYDIDSILLTREVRPSVRVVERMECRWVVTMGKWSYSYSDGEDFEYVEYSDQHDFIQAVLDVTNIFNHEKIANMLMCESYTKEEEF